MVIVKTVWSPKIRQRKLRALYRRLKRQMLDDETLLDVGWHLYLRAKDVQTFRNARTQGEVPCPGCQAVVRRKQRDVVELIADGNYAIGWFHCPKCTRRLLWQDCRDSLKRMPRCFTCLEVLTRDPATDLWVCSCGRQWSSKAYRSSVRGRVRLPCPGCGFRLHKETHAPSPYQSTRRKEIEHLTCPKCAGSAVHAKGDIRCESCGYRRRWRSYRRSIKRRDEPLRCDACGLRFQWQAWRRHARQYQLATGNMGVVEAYLKKWPKCRRSEEMVSRIDLLVQAIHGRGALGPVFIEGNDRSVRALLDELAG